MLGELNDTQIRNVLASQVIGRLACADKSQPYIVPVTYVYDGNYIYGQTTEGAKLRILRKNPNVCFQVDMMTDMRNWQSVVVFGKFEELKDKNADEARDIMFNRIFSLMTSSTVHTHEHNTNSKIDDTTRHKPIMYRIKIKKIAGRFEKQ